MDKARSSGGFLLLETLLAMAILSAGLVAVFAAFSRATDAVRRSQERLEAGLLLEQRVWDIEQTGRVETSPVQSPSNDDLEDPAWRVQNDDVADRGLERLNVELSWGRERQREELSLPVYRVR